MGCFQSTEAIDFDTIQPAVLRTRQGTATYSGTTERGRCQVRFPFARCLVIIRALFIRSRLSAMQKWH